MRFPQLYSFKGSRHGFSTSRRSVRGTRGEAPARLCQRFEKSGGDTEGPEPRNREACQSLTACVTVNSSHLIQLMGAPSGGVEGSDDMFAEIIARTAWQQGLLERGTSLLRVCPSMRATDSWEDYDRVSEVPGQPQKLIPYTTWLGISS